MYDFSTVTGRIARVIESSIMEMDPISFYELVSSVELVEDRELLAV